MKANELMIGDWVVYNGDTDYIYPVKVQGMDIATGSLITSDRDDVGFEGVWSIPLTPEILEKNGFVLCGKYFELNDYFVLFRASMNVYLRREHDAFECDGYCYHYICGCRFVHELQHFIRLCGIDKEIKL